MLQQRLVHFFAQGLYNLEYFQVLRITKALESQWPKFKRQPENSLRVVSFRQRVSPILPIDSSLIKRDAGARLLVAPSSRAIVPHTAAADHPVARLRSRSQAGDAQLTGTRRPRATAGLPQEQRHCFDALTRPGSVIIRQGRTHPTLTGLSRF